MQPWLVVPAPGPWNDYGPMYALGFALSGLWLAREARRRGWAPSDAAALALAVGAGALMGSKLLVAPVAFGAIDPGSLWAAAGGRTWLGGLFGGVLVGLVAARALGLRDATDAFAPVVPLALALGRLGCLLGGCCSGLPTDAPWGIAYAAGSDPWGLAVEAGALPAHAAHTHLLHPTALYEIAAALGLAAFVRATRDDRRWDGHRLAVVLVGYLVARFGVEFVRVGAEPMLGLKPAQWCALALFPLALAVREPMAPRVTSPISVWAALSALVLAAWPLWGGVEQMVVVGLVATTGLVGLAAVARRPAIGLAVAGASAMALAVDDPEAALLEAELEAAPEEPWIGPPPTHLEGATPALILEGGAMGGSYVQTCGGPHRYAVGAVGVAYSEPLGPHADWSAGVRVVSGVDQEQFDGGGQGQEALWSVSPRATLDTRWIGGGLGFHVGRLVVQGDTGGTPLTRDGDLGLLPSARLRLGPRDYVWLDGAIAQHDPASFPGPLLEVGAGFAIAKTHPDRWTTLRLGISEAGFYAAPDIALQNGLELLPFGSVASIQVWQLGLTVRYHMPLVRPQE